MWAPIGPMAMARTGACAAQLSDGRILITGGLGSSGALNTVDLFDLDGSASAAEPMSAAHSFHTCVTLQDGRVLVAGGSDDIAATNLAEIYDPAVNRWSTAGQMEYTRSGHTATLLKDGRVLIAGGESQGSVRNTLEIFEPGKNSFRFLSTGVLSSARKEHAAVLLRDGRVLIVGGSDGTNALASSDFFDTAAGAVLPGPDLAAPRAGLSATVMLDGTVLIAGGNNGSEDAATAEIYDPAASQVTESVRMTARRRGHLAFLLPHNNQVLLVGGDATGSSAELYAPWRHVFQPTGGLEEARSGAVGAAMASDGLLLLAGGRSRSRVLESSRAYRFATLKTDQEYYDPGDVVAVTGSGWQSGENVALMVHESPKRHADRTLNVKADASGKIETEIRQLIQDPAMAYYFTAQGSLWQAQTSSGSNPAANLNQCAEGSGLTALQQLTASCNWVNGNVNGSKATYFEGDSLPYQLVMTSLSQASHTVTIQWDTTQSGKHALDYLTTYNRTVAAADPCSNVSGCSGTPTTYGIPQDLSLVGAGPNGSTVPQVTGNFTMWGGSISGVSAYTLSGAYSTSSSMSITITFSASQPTVVLAWGGHIATRLDWGIGNSAVAISGSPFHTRLIGLDGSGGNQDRALSSDAVTFPASITITKVANLNGSPITSQAFSFTASPSPLQNFTLCGSSATCSTTFANITNLQSYTVNEPAPLPPGWSFDSLACTVSGGLSTTPPTPSGASVTINLKEGDNVNCTYTNHELGTALTVIKHVSNTHGGTNVAGDFTMNVSATGGTASPASFKGSESGTVVTISPGASYTVTETGPGGYTASLSTGCSGSIPAGGSATCTVTNSDQVTHLKLVKNVNNTHGGSAVASSWTLTATGKTPYSGSGGFDLDVLPDTYTLSESGPSGYTAGAWSCTGSGTQSGSQITLALGQSATCTIINSDQGAHLKLIKNVSNTHGGTASASSWTLAATGKMFYSGAGGFDLDVNADTYTLSESSTTINSGYTAGAWSCTGGTQNGNQITLAVGQSATCTITNSDQTAHLKLIKSVSNTHGGTAAATDWTLSATGNIPYTGAGGLDVDVKADTYTLSETSAITSGYTAGAWSCIGGTQNGNQITLALGQSAVCTIINSDQPASLTITKVCAPTTDTITSFNVNITPTSPSGTAIPTSLTCGGSQTRTLSAGSYQLGEGSVAGWNGTLPTGWATPGMFAGACDANGNVSLANGDTKTCFILNVNNVCTPAFPPAVTQSAPAMGPLQKQLRAAPKRTK